MNVTLDLNIKIDTDTSSPIQYYAVMHDKEEYYFGVNDSNEPSNWDWRVGDPEVFNLEPIHATPLTEFIQNVCFGLLLYGAPSLSLDVAKNKYRVIYQDDIAFCNGKGYPHKGTTKRADYINGTNLNEPVPEFDKPRVCGGSLLTGEEEGGYLRVNTINPNELITLQQIIDRHLYIWAVTVGNNFAADFVQGMGETVLVPLVASKTVYYPLNKLRKLPLGYDVKNHNPHTYII
jgi:hypothetical protein